MVGQAVLDVGNFATPSDVLVNLDGPELDALVTGLSGDADVLDQFEILGLTSDSGIDWIELRPRSAESDFESIGLGFRGEDLVQVDLDDRLGQRTRVSLSGIERPGELADETFVFDVPEGVDVIGEEDL